MDKNQKTPQDIHALIAGVFAALGVNAEFIKAIEVAEAEAGDGPCATDCGCAVPADSALKEKADHDLGTMEAIDQLDVDQLKLSLFLAQTALNGMTDLMEGAMRRMVNLDGDLEPEDLALRYDPEDEGVAEHPYAGRDTWRQHVAEGKTDLGYWAWIVAQLDATRDELDAEDHEVTVHIAA